MGFEFGTFHLHKGITTTRLSPRAFTLEQITSWVDACMRTSELNLNNYIRITRIMILNDEFRDYNSLILNTYASLKGV